MSKKLGIRLALISLFLVFGLIIIVFLGLTHFLYSNTDIFIKKRYEKCNINLIVSGPQGYCLYVYEKKSIPLLYSGKSELRIVAVDNSQQINGYFAAPYALNKDYSKLSVDLSNYQEKITLSDGNNTVEYFNIQYNIFGS